MRRFLLAIAGIALVVAAVTASAQLRTASVSDTEAGFEAPEPHVEGPMTVNGRRFVASSWVRPTGPVKVALQAGHWKSSEVPEELDGLRGNGAKWNGVHERDVTTEIAERAAAMLRSEGVLVDVLPTTVPPSYYADAFVSIHADGNPDSSVAGFKVAAPWKDATGNADALAALLDELYGERTGFVRDPNVTSNMRGYYAFNWRKYEHALHPMTPAAILETGFLTNAGDRALILHDQDVPARAVTDAVLRFLEAYGPRTNEE